MVWYGVAWPSRYFHYTLVLRVSRTTIHKFGLCLFVCSVYLLFVLRNTHIFGFITSFRSRACGSIHSRHIASSIYSHITTIHRRASTVNAPTSEFTTVSVFFAQFAGMNQNIMGNGHIITGKYVGESAQATLRRSRPWSTIINFNGPSFVRPYQSHSSLCGCVQTSLRFPKSIACLPINNTFRHLLSGSVRENIRCCGGHYMAILSIHPLDGGGAAPASASPTELSVLDDCVQCFNGFFSSIFI